MNAAADEVARAIAKRERKPSVIPKVNYAALTRLITRKRTDAEMSLRDVADQTNVSPSTLSRLENGIEVLDTENLLKLLAWLEVDFSAVITLTSKTPALVLIENLVAADETLPARARPAVMNMIVAMYKFFGEKKK